MFITKDWKSIYLTLLCNFGQITNRKFITWNTTYLFKLMLSIKLIISIGMLNENFQVYEIKKLQNNIKVYSIGGLTLSEKTTHKMKENICKSFI